MNLIVLTCPQCGFSRDVPREKIPVTARQVNCPRCGERFPLPPLVQPLAPEPDVVRSALPGSPPERAPDPPRDSAREAPPAPSPADPPQAPAVPSAGTTDARPRHVPFTFSGTARDYFGIWIVNALLKVVTVGFYSPWAKVRKRRFFFGHTRIDNANFDYLADPMALFRGWLLGIALFMGYSLVGNLIPLIGQLVGVLFFLAVMPWLVVRSRMFNSRYSSHRNIRFNFIPNYREAYIAYAAFPAAAFVCFFLAGLSMALLVEHVPVLAAVTAVAMVLVGLMLLPYFAWRQKRFLVENTRFGRTPFTFHARPRDFYLIALKSFGILVLVVALVTAGGMATTSLSLFAGSDVSKAAFPAMFIIGYFGFIAAYLMIILYWQVRVINLTWCSTRLGPHRLVSALRTRDMLWIYLSSAVAIMFSIGLLIPWAAVRMARYRIGRTALVAHGNLDNFISAVSEEIDAIGEEIGDIFDIDIEIGF